MREPSRRTLLRAGIGVGASALAGCIGGEPANPGSTTGETTTDGPTTDSTTATATDTPERVAWRTDLDGAVRLGPAILDGTLYVGDASGVLRALDPADGTERWRLDTDGSFFTGTGEDRSPLLVDGTLYAVSGSRSGAHGDGFALYAVDPGIGEKRWSAGEDYPDFLSLLGVAGGNAFVATSDDALSDEGEQLRALDVETGEERWTGEVGDARGAAVTGDGVYVAASTRLDAFDAADGAHRFGRELDGWTLGPAAGDGVVYVGYRGEQGRALALDPASGETRWTAGEWYVTSLVADESLYVGGERVAAFAPDGTERWRYDAGGLLSAGALADDALFVSGNPVAKLSTDDGSERWRHEVDAEHGTVEATGESTVAVQRGNGTALDVLDEASGEKRFGFDARGERLSAVAVADGTVYAGTDAGVVYALGD